MKSEDVRANTVEELAVLEGDLRRQLWKARFDNHTNQLDDTSSIPKLCWARPSVCVSFTTRPTKRRRRPRSVAAFGVGCPVSAVIRLALDVLAVSGMLDLAVRANRDCLLHLVAHDHARHSLGNGASCCFLLIAHDSVSVCLARSCSTVRMRAIVLRISPMRLGFSICSEVL